MEVLERYITSSHLPISADFPSTSDLSVAVLAYKKAARKVHPVAASLPEDFRIIRRRPEDPLLSLPTLPTHPPKFTPGTHLTQECFDTLNLNWFDFLWPEEMKLAAHVLKSMRRHLRGPKLSEDNFGTTTSRLSRS